MVSTMKLRMAKEAKKAEMEVTKRVKGRREKASGAVARSNDILTHPAGELLKGFSIEVKTTQRKSFTITETLIKVVEDKARRLGKRPLLVISLKGKLLWVVWDDDVTVKDGGLMVQN
jgi:Holliday junction resolvase